MHSIVSRRRKPINLGLLFDWHAEKSKQTEFHLDRPFDVAPEKGIVHDGTAIAATVGEISGWLREAGLRSGDRWRSSRTTTSTWCCGRRRGPDRRAAGDDSPLDRAGAASADDERADPERAGGQPRRAGRGGQGRRRAAPGRRRRVSWPGDRHRDAGRRRHPVQELRARTRRLPGPGRRRADDLHPHLRHHRRPQAGGALGRSTLLGVAHQAGDDEDPVPARSGRPTPSPRASPSCTAGRSPGPPPSWPARRARWWCWPSPDRTSWPGRSPAPADHLEACPTSSSAGRGRRRPSRSCSPRCRSVHQHVRRDPPADRAHLPRGVPRSGCRSGARRGARPRSARRLHGPLHPRPGAARRGSREAVTSNVGRSIPCVTGVKVVDPQTGARRAAGRPRGCVLVRTAGRCLTYLGEDDRHGGEDLGRLVEHRRHRDARGSACCASSTARWT